jgi:hypothetical protein
MSIQECFECGKIVHDGDVMFATHQVQDRKSGFPISLICRDCMREHMGLE